MTMVSIVGEWRKAIMVRCLAKWTQGDDVWLESRQGLMTATKAVNSLSLGYGNPMDVYQEWQSPDYRPEFTASQKLRMKIGLAAEAPILEAAAVHTDRPGQYQEFECDARLVRHPEYLWAACSPDGFAISEILGKLVLEVKNTNLGTKSQYTTEDGQPCCPPGYRVQVIWNMACTGADYGVLIANFNGDLVFRLIERDEEEVAFIFSEVKTFLDACEGDDQLAIFNLIQDGAKRWDAVRDIYRNVSDEGIAILDAELDVFVSDYLKIDKELKEVTERHKWLKSNIAERIGGHRRLETARHRISWGQNPGREKFDLELFKAKNPTIDVNEYYTRSRPYRTGMRISVLKEAK